MVVEREGDGISRAWQAGQRGDLAVLPEIGGVAGECIGVGNAVRVDGNDAVVVDRLLPHPAIGRARQQAQIRDGVAISGSGAGSDERQSQMTGQRKTEWYAMHGLVLLFPEVNGDLS